jgi:hypothetical protein
MTALSISLHTSAEAIGREAWTRLCPPAHPFLNYDFLSVLERHGAAGPACGWQAQHLAASDGSSRVVGILPLYLRSNSHGDFIYDWSWASAYRQLGRIYYPKLLSAVPHTPASGSRFLVEPGADAPSVRRALMDAAIELGVDLGVSSWHVALPDEDDHAALLEAGLLTSHNVQFHWLAGESTDFDDYLAVFSAEKRRKVRAERRKVAESGLTIEVRHGDEVVPSEWPILHALYASTFDKFGNYAVFSASCFAELARVLGRRMVVFIARDGSDGRQGGGIVAMSLCFRSDTVLYGRYWGCRETVHSLHFELCFYQGIAYCLREGLARFEPGAGGEHKVARGFVPTMVRSVHWIADRTMRTLIDKHLRQQGPLVAAYRDDAAEHLPFRRA